MAEERFPKHRLWDYVDGEPFLVNPALAIYANPPKSKSKKGRKNMAVRRRARVVRRRRNVSRLRNAPKRRRRTARRNPYPLAGVALNPRRRRRSSHLRNPHRRRRHVMRRNPAFLGVALPGIKQIGLAAGGYIGTQVISSYLMGATSPVPVSMIPSTPIGRYAFYIGTALGLTFAAKKLSGSSDAAFVAVGSSVFIIKQALMDFMPGVLPGLSAYTPGNGGMRLAQLGAYTRGTGPNQQTLGAYGRANFPGSQGTRNIIPTRFNRF
jgi:hypothetical protein